MTKYSLAVLVAASSSILYAPTVYARRADTTKTATVAKADGGQKSEDMEFAERLFREGYKLYAEGMPEKDPAIQTKKYRDAIQKFKESRRVLEAAAGKSPDKNPRIAAIDFNIARVHDRLGEWEAAAGWYEIYIQDEESGKVDATAMARYKELTERLYGRTHDAEAKLPSSPTDLAPLPPPSPSRRLRLVPLLVVGGVAVAAAITGVALYASASSDLDGLNRTCPYPCAGSEADSVRSRAYASYSLLGIAAAAAAVDIALGIIWWRKGWLKKEAATALAISPTVGGVAVGLSGSF